MENEKICISFSVEHTDYFSAPRMFLLLETLDYYLGRLLNDSEMFIVLVAPLKDVNN